MSSVPVSLFILIFRLPHDRSHIIEAEAKQTTFARAIMVPARLASVPVAFLSADQTPD